MIHYSCDRCRKPIDPEEDLRYVVKVEIQLAMEPVDAEELDDERDHLLEIQEILERLDDEENGLVGEEIYERRTFDLCADCYRKYRRSPVGNELPAQLDFSNN